MFVTLSAYSGNLGGLAGADQKCQTAANAQLLGGTFKAWLSDATTNAIDRINDVGPWYRVGSTAKMFNNKANLSTVPLSPVSYGEDGREFVVSREEAWTGTMAGGTRAADTCSGWTTTAYNYRGRYGVLVSSTSAWTESLTDNCDVQKHLYCIEQ